MRTSARRGILMVVAVIAIATAFTPISVAAQPAASQTPRSEKSADLSQFLNTNKGTGGITIAGLTKNENGSYSYFEGQTASITFHWAERNDLQFDVHNTMFYDMPAGFLPLSPQENEEKTFTVSINDGGKLYEIDGNTYKFVRIDNSDRYKILIDFNKNHADFASLENAANIELNLNMQFTMSQVTEKNPFGQGVDMSFELDTSRKPTLNVNKYASINASEGKVHYTVEVKSTDGTSFDVSVHDTMPQGDVLTFDQSSLQWDPRRDTDSCSTTQNSFDCTISQIKQDETIRFTYTASFSEDAYWQALANNNGNADAVAEQYRNVANASADKSNPGEDDTWMPKPQFNSYVNKSGSAEAAVDGWHTVNWTVNVNEQRQHSLAGSVISDDMVKPGDDWKTEKTRENMVFAGDGISVQVFDQNGNELAESPRKLSWAEVGVHNLNVDKKWEYQVPASDGAYQYRITYSTKVKEGIEGNTVVNTASSKYHSATTEVYMPSQDSGDGGDSGDTPSKPTFPENALTKSVDTTASTAEKTQWNIDVKTPEGGYESLTVTDTLPMQYVNATERHYSDYLDGMQVDNPIREDTTTDIDKAKQNIRVAFTANNGAEQVLSPTDDYTVNVSFRTNDHTKPSDDSIIASIVLTEAGLAKISAEGVLRVTLVTVNNQHWVQNSGSEDWYAEHKNTASAQANNASMGESSATVRLSPQANRAIAKTVSDKDAGTVSGPTYLPNTLTTKDGKNVPVWYFRVMFDKQSYPANGTQVVDTFDANKFRLVTPEDFNFADGNFPNRIKKALTFRYSESENKCDMQKESIVDVFNEQNYAQHFSQTDTGVTINLPESSKWLDTNDVTHFGVMYALTPTAQYLRSIDQEAVNSATGMLNFHNDASWGTNNASAEFHYENKPMSKSVNTSGLSAQNSKLDFTLDVNPKALQIGDDDTVDVRDTMSSNLRMKLNTIVVRDVASGMDITSEITISEADGTYTFTVPNGRHICITYSASVFSSDSSSSVSFSNTASINGFSTEQSDSVAITSSAGGNGSSPAMYLYKYKSGDMNKPLAGVTFDLQEQTNGAWNTVGRYTSNERGEIHISAAITDNGKPTDNTLEFDVPYALVETKALRGYRAPEQAIYFMIRSNPLKHNAATSDARQFLQLATGDTLPVSNDPIPDPEEPEEPDDPTVTLPGAGGRGVTRWMTLGFAVVVLAMLAHMAIARRSYERAGEPLH